MVGQLAHGLDHRRGDGRGGVVVGQAQQDGEPGSALHQGAHCAAVASAHDEVAFPMPRYRAVVGFGGPVTHGEDLFGSEEHVKKKKKKKRIVWLRSRR